MIPQNLTERLLIEDLEQHGVTIERQVELVAFTQSERAVHGELRRADGSLENIETPWLIGCDGAHSTVRHTLGMGFSGHGNPNDWILADVRLTGPLARDEVSIFWHEAGVVAFFPIDAERTRVIADMGITDREHEAGQLHLREVQAIIDQRGPGSLQISDPVWMTHFRISERKVKEYWQGRVILAGDAAHIHSPAGGQGMNTGMQDAFNLAWKLALLKHGIGKPEPLLESYSAERSAVGDRVLQNAERVTSLATLRSPIARWMRNHLVPILGSFQFVQEKIRDEWFEISINYRHSPLSSEYWTSQKGDLGAGDRMCDAPLVSTARSQTSSLFQLFDGIRFTLLLLPVASDNAAAHLLAMADTVEQTFPSLISTQWILPTEAQIHPALAAEPFVWRDLDGRIYQRMRADEPALILVRPDGYIGFRCQPPSSERLISYLDHFLFRGNG